MSQERLKTKLEAEIDEKHGQENIVEEFSILKDRDKEFGPEKSKEDNRLALKQQQARVEQDLNELTNTSDQKRRLTDEVEQIKKDIRAIEAEQNIALADSERFGDKILSKIASIIGLGADDAEVRLANASAKLISLRNNLTEKQARLRLVQSNLETIKKY